MLIGKYFGMLNIKEFGAKSDGITDDGIALNKVLQSNYSDTIVIPKGVYLIKSNVVVPSSKKFIFDHGAVLKVASGVNVTINGTWDANSDYQIFDLSLGGIINGDFKIDEIYPEWLGAKGDGVTDDAQAFNNAMALCDKKRIIKLGAKTYKLKSTVETNCRGIVGVNTYTDSQNGGTHIVFDPTDTTTDLIPAIRINEAGANSVFEKFRVSGNTDYSSRYLANWINKEKFNAGTYDMFTAGIVAIEVTGTATPILREISTSRVKVGLLLNSTHGHVTSYDSSWNGLIGVYCRKNSEDYFFQGGGISGAFCGLMIGVITIAGHNGGMTALTINRVHMGFSPYGVFQVIDVDPAVYAGFSSVAGLNGYFEGRFEQIGEAAIKLLPKSITSGLYMNGFGMGFSAIDYTDTPGRWQYSLPDSLMLANEKQKYSVWLGTLQNSRIIDDRGAALKSTAPGALGTAYIEILQEGNEIKGLVPSKTVVKRKITKVSVQLSQAIDAADSIREYANSPISHGNLIEPEKISSWTVTSGATVELISDLSTLPAPFTEEMKRYLGTQVPVIKITPNGTNSPNIIIKPSTVPLLVDTSRMINYEYFIYAPSGVVASRIDYQNSKFLYNETYGGLSKTNWSRIVGRELMSPEPNLNQITLFQASPTLPTYIVGLMLSYDRPGSYSPYKHNFTRNAIETTDGLILNSASGNRYKIVPTNDGGLSLIDVSTGSVINNYATVGKVATLPTAAAEQRGRIITVPGAVGSADKVYVCKKLANESYAWVEI